MDLLRCAATAVLDALDLLGDRGLGGAELVLSGHNDHDFVHGVTAASWFPTLVSWSGRRPIAVWGRRPGEVVSSPRERSGRRARSAATAPARRTGPPGCASERPSPRSRTGGRSCAPDRGRNAPHGPLSAPEPRTRPHHPSGGHAATTRTAHRPTCRTSGRARRPGHVRSDPHGP